MCVKLAETLRHGHRCSEFLDETSLEPKAAHGRSLVVADDATRNAKEPQPILRRRGDRFEAAPRDDEHLGQYVLGVVGTNPSAQVPRYRLDMPLVERLE